MTPRAKTSNTCLAKIDQNQMDALPPNSDTSELNSQAFKIYVEDNKKKFKKLKPFDFMNKMRVTWFMLKQSEKKKYEERAQTNATGVRKRIYTHNISSNIAEKIRKLERKESPPSLKLDRNYKKSISPTVVPKEEVEVDFNIGLTETKYERTGAKKGPSPKKKKKYTPMKLPRADQYATPIQPPSQPPSTAEALSSYRKELRKEKQRQENEKVVEPSTSKILDVLGCSPIGSEKKARTHTLHPSTSKIVVTAMPRIMLNLGHKSSPTPAAPVALAGPKIRPVTATTRVEPSVLTPKPAPVSPKTVPFVNPMKNVNVPANFVFQPKIQKPFMNMGKTADEYYQSLVGKIIGLSDEYDTSGFNDFESYTTGMTAVEYTGIL